MKQWLLQHNIALRGYAYQVLFTVLFGMAGAMLLAIGYRADGSSAHIHLILGSGFFMLYCTVIKAFSLWTKLRP